MSGSGYDAAAGRGRPGTPDGGAGALDRVVDRCLRYAAGRWPADLSSALLEEWRAEVSALKVEPGVGRLARARAALAFAGSLAATTPPDRPCRPHPRAAGTLAAAAAVVLCAGALANLTRLADHAVAVRLPTVPLVVAGASVVGAAVLLAVATGGCARRYGPAERVTAGHVLAIGSLTYLFLLLGNRVPVMPFMGFRDLAPAVGAWTLVSAATLAYAGRLAAAGRRRVAAAVVWAGSATAMQSAAVAGCWHAASALGAGLSAAPAWLPLALLPGGLTEFGPPVAAGQVGPLAAGLPPVPLPASAVLLGNAAAMLGPLLLCSAFLAGYALSRTRRDAAAFGRRPAGAVLLAALVGLALPALAPMLVVAPSGAEAAARIAQHSMVFGFGFLAGPLGRMVLAMLAAALVAYRPEPTGNGGPAPN